MGIANSNMFDGTLEIFPRLAAVKVVYPVGQQHSQRIHYFLILCGRLITGNDNLLDGGFSQLVHAALERVIRKKRLAAGRSGKAGQPNTEYAKEEGSHVVIS